MQQHSANCSEEDVKQQACPILTGTSADRRGINNVALDQARPRCEPPKLHAVPSYIGNGNTTVPTDESRSELQDQNEATEQDTRGEPIKGGEHDSLAMSTPEMAELSTHLITRLNIYALLTQAVLLHHSFFAHQGLFGQFMDASQVQETDSVAGEIIMPLAWHQTLPIYSMTSFAMIAGATDRRYGIPSSRLLHLLGMLWITYYSQITTVFLATLHGLLPQTWLRWLQLHDDATTRFTEPSWFLLALLIWESIAYVSACCRCRWLPPVASIVSHFVCFGGACAWPFQREPVFNIHTQRHTRLIPHVKPPGDLASTWMHYAAVPLLLPSRFPVELPGEAYLARRYGSPRGTIRARTIWRIIFVILLDLHSIRNPINSNVMSPSLGGSMLSIPYAYSRCAYGSIRPEPGTERTCSPHDVHRAAHFTWSFEHFAYDLFSCAVSAAFTVGLCAWMPQRRIPVLSKIGLSCEVIFLFGTYVTVFTDKIIALPLLTGCYALSKSAVVVLLVTLLYCCAVMYAIAATHEGLARVSIHTLCDAICTRIRSSVERVCPQRQGETLAAGKPTSSVKRYKSRPSSHVLMSKDRLWMCTLLFLLLSTKPSYLREVTENGRMAVTPTTPWFGSRKVNKADQGNKTGHVVLHHQRVRPYLLRPGIENVKRGVKLLGGPSEFSRSMLVSSPQECYMACEAVHWCLQFVFEAPLPATQAVTSRRSRWLQLQSRCMLNTKTSTPAVLIEEVPGERVVFSGKIQRNGGRVQHKHALHLQRIVGWNEILPGKANIQHGILIEGSSLTAESSNHLRVTSPQECYVACEREPKCLQFVFKSTVPRRRVVSRPKCLLKPNSSAPLVFIGEVPGQRAVWSGRIERLPSNYVLTPT